jgi:hypothetical protein
MNNEDRIFQEKPKNTQSCTLVTDSPDTQKIRTQIKDSIAKYLKPKSADFDVEESESRYVLTQRFTDKPAVMVVRLRSYKKSMQLFAYNAFEIYHGNCPIVSMKLKNDLENKTIEQHVKNAVKTFKEQCGFSKHTIAKFKKEHKKQLKQEKIAAAKAQKTFGKIGIEADKDGMVNVFHWSQETPVKTSLTELSRCNKLTFAPKDATAPTTRYDRLDSSTDLVCSYDKHSDMWNVTYDSNDKEPIDIALSLFKKYQKGVKAKSEKGLYTPQLDYHNGISTKTKKPYTRTTFKLYCPTDAMAQIVKMTKLSIWKIERD